tara:strand:- start:56 stop:727 length:672 start_codon:yes stop_codon:yes gene_type:complete
MKEKKMFSKTFSKLLTLTIINFCFISCGGGDHNLVDIQYSITPEYIEIYGGNYTRGPNKKFNEDQIVFQDKFYFQEEYSKSFLTYLENKNGEYFVKFSINIEDYFKNIHPSEFNYIKSPDGRDLPNIKGRGGDGVGNMYHGNFSELMSENKRAAIYQNKKYLGFYYPIKRQILAGAKSLTTTTRVKKIRAFVTIMFGDENDPTKETGIFLAIPKLRKEIKSKQ